MRPGTEAGQDAATIGDLLRRIWEREWTAAVALALVIGFVAIMTWWRRRHDYHAHDTQRQPPEDERPGGGRRG